MKKSTRTVLVLIIALTTAFVSCKKEDDNSGNPGGSNTPQKSKMQLITRTWIMKEIRNNGALVTSQGTTPYLFEAGGAMKSGKDASGNWKQTSTWGFTGSDSASIYVYKGQPNQQLWKIKSLAETKMEIDYMADNGDKFNFVLVP